MKDTLVEIADAHVKWRDNTQELMYTMQVLEEGLAYAIELKADIIFPGDLIDQKPAPIEVLLALYEFFKRCKSHGVEVYKLRGNHVSLDHSQPEKSIIVLFDAVCHIINRPAFFENERFFVAMVPWYRDEKLKQLFAAAANKAKAAGRKRTCTRIWLSRKQIPITVCMSRTGSASNTYTRKRTRMYVLATFTESRR